MKRPPKKSAIILFVLTCLATLGLIKRDSKSTNGASINKTKLKVVLVELKNAFTDKNLTFFAAGVAYFSTLAFFPLIVAMVAIVGLVVSSQDLGSVLSVISRYSPQDLSSLITTQLENASKNEASGIFTASVAMILALFSVSGAAQNLIQALNVAYEVEEKRGFLRLRSRSVLLTICLIIFIGLVLGLLIINPFILNSLGVPAWLAEIYPIMRWLVLIGLIIIALAMLYRYAPNHQRTRLRWISLGSIVATGLWMLATWVFFVYVQYFSNFSDTYSLFAGIIVLMIWLNISTLVVLVGARVDRRLVTYQAN